MQSDVFEGGETLTSFSEWYSDGLMQNYIYICMYTIRELEEGQNKISDYAARKCTSPSVITVRLQR